MACNNFFVVAIIPYCNDFVVIATIFSVVIDLFSCSGIRVTLEISTINASCGSLVG